MGQPERAREREAKESIKRGRLGIFGATLQHFTIQRFNVREAICQILDAKCQLMGVASSVRKSF